ncbi:DUF3413 domain-containing protein [Paraferrimonas sp. SM1919]|uniref:DUF3413 domain-containing protein n=1 Tax=Paraferrimonas sp. SM1919 TaxID=2662263 RepID=UPI0013D1E297|nr:DUF3413 domain-containing protein [Paraferrimonas sp. SM1919]
MKANLTALFKFIILVSVLAVLISYRYFLFFPDTPYELWQTSYTVASLFSHLTLLTLLASLPLLVLTWLPSRAFKTIAAIWATLGLLLLLIDTTVFEFYRFHLNLAILQMFMTGEVITLDWMAWLAFFVCFGLGSYGLWRAYQWLASKNVGKLPKYFWSSFLVCLLYSHGSSIWANGIGFQPLKVVDLYLPAYYPSTARTLLNDLGLIDLKKLEANQAKKPAFTAKQNYPTQPLVTEAIAQPKDIMLVVVDTWRFDSLTNESMPFLYDAAKQGLNFQKHRSSGNATRMSMFGMFYGLPGGYWETFLANKRAPILVERMQELNYDMGIFASAQLEFPEFNRTLFASIDNLRIRTEGETPAARDRQMVDDWKAWYQQPSDDPRFSFLFFDAVHGYDFPEDYPHKKQPMVEANSPFGRGPDVDPTPLLNRYLTSVHYVDSLLAEVAETLDKQGRLDNTVIIVTSDHGDSINDYGLNYWGHGSSFSDPQVHVPLVMFGAGVAPSDEALTKLSTHYDLPVTILKNYLGVTSDPASYAIGVDLFESLPERKFSLVTDNHRKDALVSDDGVFVIGGNGLYQNLDSQSQPTQTQKLDKDKMKYLIEVLSRFNGK